MLHLSGVQVGSRVRLHGLARTDLNGRDAKVVAIAKGDRLGVLVDGSITPFAIKPVNLLATSGSDTADLGSLPKELIQHCLCLTASTDTLARASFTSRLLRDCASAAAIERGYSLGYDEFDDAHGPLIEQNMLSELHRLHVDPDTARLPPSIPICDEQTALQFVRDEFDHFEPRLCRTLRLPDLSEVPAALRDVEGDTEYANLAALLRAAGASSSNVPSIQRAVEGGWAEGFDRLGAADFNGRLGEDACIGAAEVLVALWHLRFRASMVEIDSPRSAGKAVFQLISTLVATPSRAWGNFSRDLPEGSPAWLRQVRAEMCPYPNEWPIFLQTQGQSFLVVGVTTAIHKAVLLLDPTLDEEDPTSSMEPRIAVRSIESLNGAQYQVVICHGQCGQMSKDEILNVNGQQPNGEIVNAATFKASPSPHVRPQWEFHPRHQWLRAAMMGSA